jgi:hypothetical protein
MDASKTTATLLPSAVRTTTASATSTDQSNLTARGLMVFVDFTATPNDAQTATVAIQGKDPASGKYSTLTAFTALTASVLGATPTTETYAYTLIPGGAETAATAKHEVQALTIPNTWRLVVTLSAAGNWTFTAGYSYL